MAKKKKKGKVKHQEIEQKESFQEPQEVMGLESEESMEESEMAEGMIYCKSCKKDIEPYPVENNKWRCPDCNKYTQSPDMKGKNVEILKETKPSKDRPYEIHSSRNIKFSGNELAQAEMLIASGVASNFNDLAKKAFNILFLKEKVNKAFGVDTNKMENQEPNPKRTMAQIQEQKLMEAYIKSMEDGNKSDPMMTMMMMRVFENQSKGKESGDNGFMKDLMQMQMMKMMSGGNDQQANTLQREIADLKHQQSMYQALAQQQQNSQGNQASQEFMAKIEGIRADRDKELKRIEIDSQKQRDKNMQMAFDSKVGEIQREMDKVSEEAKRKGEKADLTSFKDQLTMVKELNTMVGEREKGAGEYIAETVTNVATQLQPALQNYMQQKASQPQYVQAPPMPEQPMPQENSGNPPEYVEPEFPLPDADMSPSEQQMSDTMDSMYIKERKKKE